MTNGRKSVQADTPVSKAFTDEPHAGETVSVNRSQSSWPPASFRLIDGHASHAPRDETPMRPFVNPIKGRYCNAYSNVVFPKRLATDLSLDVDIRLHSYGWNASIRPEPKAMLFPAVKTLVLLQDVTIYGAKFFEAVDPVYHFINQERFFERVTRFWSSPVATLDDFEALVAGVVGLGSFFSEHPLSVETQLMDHLKAVLDYRLTVAPGKLSLDQGAGWVLRTLYLRLTTRPSLSWIASCTSMHVAESMALHIDLSRAVVASTEGAAIITQELETARKNLLECVTFLNVLLSAEYGRSRVLLRDAAESQLQPQSTLGRLTEILEMIDDTNPDPGALKAIEEIPSTSPVISALKVDLAMHFYRRFVDLTEGRISKHHNQAMVRIIRESMTAIRELLNSRQPWWHIILTPFQAVCILLSMDTDASLRMIPEVMALLKESASQYPSHLPTEAVETAERLINAVQRRKLEQAERLSAPHSKDSQAQSLSSTSIPDGMGAPIINDFAADMLAGFGPFDGLYMDDSLLDFPADQSMALLSIP